MIRLWTGWLPCARRRTPTYTVWRTRRRSARRSAVPNHDQTLETSGRANETPYNRDMLFDQPPAELPVATLRPREAGTQLRIDARNWFGSKWRWFQPRTVPVLVAVAGMVGLIASANYLRSFGKTNPEQLSIQVRRTAPVEHGFMRLDLDNAPARIIIDGKLSPDAVANQQLDPGVYKIDIVPAPASEPGCDRDPR